jgi:hypothetical protein
MTTSIDQIYAPPIMKAKIRPLYYTLQGFLKESPPYQKSEDILHDKTQWEYINSTIDRLNAVTEKNYDDFKITEEVNHNGVISYSYVRLSMLKGQLAGLINYLHGEFFSDEPAPLCGNPSMVINQHQQQSTSIVLLLDSIDTMLVRWFPQRAAVGKLLFHHSQAITMEEKAHDHRSDSQRAGAHHRGYLVCSF